MLKCIEPVSHVTSTKLGNTYFNIKKRRDLTRLRVHCYYPQGGGRTANFEDKITTLHLLSFGRKQFYALKVSYNDVFMSSNIHSKGSLLRAV